MSVFIRHCDYFDLLTYFDLFSQYQIKTKTVYIDKEGSRVGALSKGFDTNKNRTEIPFRACLMS